MFMKRILLALAVQAALATPILADYLVIRINLSPEAQQGDQPLVNAGASAPQGGGMNLGLGSGGGMSGKGGGRGAGGGLSAGGGTSIGGGPPSGAASPPRGGNFARGGGQGGALGGAAPPPNFGVGSSGSGAAGGGRAGGFRLNPGASGGAPQQRGRGAGAGDDAVSSGGGAGAAAPTEGGFAAAELAPSKGDLFVVALEVNVSRSRTSNKVILAHKWGTTVLDPEASLPGKATMQLIKTPQISDRLAKARHDYVDGQANKQYLKLAEWMLQNWNLPSDGKFSMHE
jgi:hypothetical protein